MMLITGLVDLLGWIHKDTHPWMVVKGGGGKVEEVKAEEIVVVENQEESVSKRQRVPMTYGVIKSN